MSAISVILASSASTSVISTRTRSNGSRISAGAVAGAAGVDRAALLLGIELDLARRLRHGPGWLRDVRQGRRHLGNVMSTRLDQLGAALGGHHGRIHRGAQHQASHPCRCARSGIVHHRSPRGDGSKYHTGGLRKRRVLLCGESRRRGYLGAPVGEASMEISKPGRTAREVASPG